MMRAWSYSQYPTEPRGVKSLTGLKEITYMNREECDIPNSFKVRHRDSLVTPVTKGYQ